MRRPRIAVCVRRSGAAVRPDQRVGAAVLATTLVGFTAVYIPYTYIGVVFEPATSGDGVRLAVLLFVLGVIGTAGNLAAGALADRLGGPRVVLIALVWLIASMLVLPLATADYGAAVAATMFYGIAAFAITTPQQHRLLSLAPGSASVLVSLNQAVLYLAIAMSGVLGGVGIGWVGPNNLSLIAAALAAFALVLSELGRRRPRRRAAEVQGMPGESPRGHGPATRPRPAGGGTAAG